MSKKPQLNVVNKHGIIVPVIKEKHIYNEKAEELGTMSEVTPGLYVFDIHTNGSASFTKLNGKIFCFPVEGGCPVTCGAPHVLTRDATE